MLRISKCSVVLFLALAGCTEQIDFENDVPQRAKAISQQQVDAMMATVDATKARETYRLYTQGSSAQAQQEKASKTLEELKREKRQIEKQIAEVSAQHRQSVCPTCHRAFHQGNAKTVKPKTARIRKPGKVPAQPRVTQTRTVRAPEQQKAETAAVLEAVEKVENVEEPIVRRRRVMQRPDVQNLGMVPYSPQQPMNGMTGQIPPYQQDPNAQFGQPVPMVQPVQPPVQPVLQPVQQVQPNQPIPQPVSVPQIPMQAGMPYGGGSAFVPQN